MRGDLVMSCMPRRLCLGPVVCEHGSLHVSSKAASLLKLRWRRRGLQPDRNNQALASGDASGDSSAVKWNSALSCSASSKPLLLYSHTSLRTSRRSVRAGLGIT
jgi:hypothetical protein